MKEESNQQSLAICALPFEHSNRAKETITVQI